MPELPLSTGFRTELPFFRDPGQLPCPLPTSEEIRAGTIRYIRENEGQTLLFLEKYPSVPAPRLYAMYRKDDTLYLLWDELSKNEKMFICEQLRRIFSQLRAIPAASPSYFGSICGGPVEHPFFKWMDEDPRINGPFKTLEGFHLGMACHLRRQEELNDRHPWVSEWFARPLPQALKDHPCTFSHSHLVKQIIMVQEQPGSNGCTVRHFKVTIIDWETAG
ncbi:hypothetical protein BDV19DRAFT_381556 [Aspergillus venezuelensis]